MTKQTWKQTTAAYVCHQNWWILNFELASSCEVVAHDVMDGVKYFSRFLAVNPNLRDNQQFISAKAVFDSSASRT